MIAKLWGRAVCWWKGKHQRGKLIEAGFDAKRGVTTTRYRCPRCGRVKTYKPKITG